MDFLNHRISQFFPLKIVLNWRCEFFLDLSAQVREAHAPFSDSPVFRALVGAGLPQVAVPLRRREGRGCTQEILCWQRMQVLGSLPQALRGLEPPPQPKRVSATDGSHLYPFQRLVLGCQQVSLLEKSESVGWTRGRGWGRGSWARRHRVHSPASRQ